MRNVIAAVHGSIYALAGVIGFALNPSGGLLLGIFAFNTFHHVFHIALGGFGLAAAKVGGGPLYCRIAGLVLLVLGALGFLTPALVAPLIANANTSLVTDNLLHLVTGTALAYFGFLPHDDAAVAASV
jgi:hypothetical protein